MASELGVGYVSIVPEVSKISPGIAKALQGVEPEADKTGRSMGSRISSGMGKVLKTSVAGVGIATGGVLAGAITKGMGRLTGIENAQASLRGLGHDAKSVETIMDDALASVSGTSYGLETAASVAASAVAAGIQPGEELERTLTMVGDAATIAGVDMESMGSIVNKVATSDMMQMDTANQLMDAGIPILQMVATEMGVTAEEARKLASDGKISFETFQTALENGVGGAALEAGNTFQGAAANMGAALGRLGATGMTPFFDLAKDGMGAATQAIDGLESTIAPMADNVAAWLQGTAVPAVKDFAASLQALGQNREVQRLADGTQAAFSQLVDAGKSLAPVVVNIASTLGEAGAALGVTAWTSFVSVLEVAGSALEAAAGPLESVTGFLRDHPGLVAAGMAAWAGFKTIPDLLGRVSSATEPLRTRTAGLGAAVSDLQNYYSSTGREISRFEALTQVAGTSSNSTLSAMGIHLNNASVEGGAFARTTGVLKAGMEGARGAASGLMGLFGGPWGVALMAAGTAIGAVSQANQRLETAQTNISDSTRDAASAQAELESAVAGTAGALNEQALVAAARVAKGELAELVEMGEAYSGWLYSVDTDTNVWERMFNIGGQWEQDKEAAREIKQSYEQLETTVGDLGFEMEDLDSIIAAGGPQYESLVASLRASDEAGSDAAAQGLEDARAKIDQMVDDARRLDPAVADAAAAIDVLAESSSTADEKLGALQSMLQAMGLAPKGAEQAMWDASEATDELVESLEGVERPAELVGQNLFDMDGALDRNNEQSRQLRDELIGLGDELQNVGTNGGDVHEAFAEMDPALTALAESFGLSKERVLELGRELGLVPDEIAIALALEGADEAAQDMASVWSAFQAYPDRKTVEVSALTDAAITDLESIGYTVEEIPGSENVLVTADTDQASSTLNGVMTQLGELDGFSVSPSVLLNTTPLEGSADNARAILDALDIQEPTPQAQIIIDQLLSGVDISQGQLDFLASQTPTPAADLNRALLEGGVSVSNEMLDALQGRRPTPLLDADGKPLNAAVNAAQGDLNRLQDKTVTITTVHHRIDYWTQQGYSREEAANIQGPVVPPGLATGGRAPGSRNPGYRLPTSGPGTEIVDGFLGLNDSMMPVARVNRGEWVINDRSSDKYDRELAAINAGVFPKLPGYQNGGRAGVSAGELLAFADGREVRGQQASRSLQGAIYDWAGINWGDCSAAMAGLARFAVGVAPFAARFATGNQREALSALGFSPGLGNPATDFSIGWLNGGPGGGHTSGTIAGTNVEMGGGAGGNGKIGGAAAGSSHPQYTDHAHLPLGQRMRSESTTVYGGTTGSQVEGDPSMPVASTSTSGVTLQNGITVGFGEATDFYQQALDYLQRPVASATVFDTGGILGTGQLAFNAGPPERILPANLTKSFDEFVVQVPGILDALGRGDRAGAQASLNEAADTMLEAARMDAKTQAERAEVEIESARSEVQSVGRHLGGDWVGQATIVRDAEQGLADLRRQLVIETENITLAEGGLAEAQEHLAEVQAEGVVLSDSTQRKLEDAEKRLADARADGDVDKITDAETKLSRAREDAAKELEKSEDKNAENVKKAMEDVAEAEDTLSEARVTNSDAAIRLEAAERAISAARYQALGDMVGGIGTALGASVGHLGGFFDEMSRLAGIVEQTRQEVSKLEMQQVTNQVNLLKAQHDLQVSEWDLQRTRARGALNLVRAEQDVEDAREKAARMGATSIEAMSGAMDRFRRNGVFSVGEVSDSVIENSKEVEAALWGVQMVEAQNALDALNSSHNQALAQFAVAEATLAQTKAAQMLHLQTAHLEQQTAQLYGLTQNQAAGASTGLGGLGSLLGGIGKVGGGILTGLAGFAAGGPLGAIPGAIMALGGLGDTIKGGIDAWNNRDDVADAWGQMGTLEKVGVIGGGLVGGAATIGGAYLGGPEGAALGAELGETIIGTTVGSVQHNISSLIEKQNRDMADRMAELELSLGRQEASLGEDKLIAELEYMRERDRLEADVAYAELMQQVAQSTSDQVTEKLLEAAEIEAARAGKASDDQLGELRRSSDSLDELVDLMRQQVDATRAGGGPVQTDQIIGGIAQILAGTGSRVSADAYMNARL